MKQLQLVTTAEDWLDDIERVMCEAFPPIERVSNKKMLKEVADGRAELLALVDGTTFVGFAFVYPQPTMYYLCMFATDATLRGQGYGSQALTLLKAHYKDKPMTLVAERPNAKAKNQAQRLSRMAFYDRNGFTPVGITMGFLSLKFNMLATAPGTTLATARALVRHIGGLPYLWLINPKNDTVK